MSDWQLSSGTVEARREERLAYNAAGFSVMAAGSQRQQQQLFDPATTLVPFCDHCRTDRKNLCRFDADVREGYLQASARRPKQCLNGIDPAHDPFPDGY